MKLKSSLWSFFISAIISISACCPGDTFLSQQIAEKVAKGDGSIINMVDLAEFPWETLHIFCPYALPEYIESELGFKWWPAHSIGLEGRDDISLLVFVEGNKVERYVLHVRSCGDFAKLNELSSFTKEESIFQVENVSSWPEIKWTLETDQMATPVDNGLNQH